MSVQQAILESYPQAAAGPLWTAQTSGYLGGGGVGVTSDGAALIVAAFLNEAVLTSPNGVVWTQRV